MLSFVRSGALLALLIVPFADRFGRRRVLLATIVGYTVMTALTALAPNAETFVALQFLARTFAVAEALLATVVIVEEFAPENRALGNRRGGGDPGVRRRLCRVDVRLRRLCCRTVGARCTRSA